MTREERALYMREYRKRHPEKLRVINARAKERKLAWQRKDRIENVDVNRIRSAKYYRNNTAKLKAIAKAHYHSGYKLRAEELRRIRRAKLKQATPKWANKKSIRAIYIAAKEFSMAEGAKYTVDHIIPLNGKLVSGLHVETNLQIIPNELNIKKRNKTMKELGHYFSSL